MWVMLKKELPPQNGTRRQEWQVGYYLTNGGGYGPTFHAIYRYPSNQKTTAANMVHYLNGGNLATDSVFVEAKP